MVYIVRSMNDSSGTQTRRQRHRQGGPPLGGLAIVSTVLFVLGIVLAAALGGVVMSPFASGPSIVHYFASQPDPVKAAGVLTFASSVPLAIYAATASARLRQLGVTAPGATIALVGGVLSAAMLGLSGLVLWTLSQPAVRGDTALVRALHDLAFVTGGPAAVVFLGLLVAGIAVPGLILGLLSRPVAIVGLAIAVLAELTTLVLIWTALTPALPVARFPALVWLIVAGFALPERRARRDAEASP